MGASIFEFKTPIIQMRVASEILISMDGTEA
jgi:hypothetical protein